MIQLKEQPCLFCAKDSHSTAFALTLQAAKCNAQLAQRHDDMSR